MGGGRAAAGSLAFFVAGPGAVAALVPWLLTGWRAAAWVRGWLPLRIVGGLLIALGLAILVGAFARFVVEGRGTPLPVAAPDRLVVGGIYRHVRNPMYAGLVWIVAGQGLLLGQVVLLAYALVVLGVTAAFVQWYEEPELARRFGAQFAAYRRAVPGWWPRWRPWSPQG